ncbi:MAG: enoyl-CoA hydratase-related protein [Chitinophagales bacterium]|nr:enoyl-CoA hydratase-related protein [Chitinophagales bacterium]
MYQTIIYEVNNGIAKLTLNRPDRYNAFNEVMSKEVIEAIKLSAKDEQVRVLVITGAGKAFCSGQDLKDASASEGRSLGDSVLRRYNPMILGLREMPKPVIAMVNGVAAGAGASLAFACDYIIASRNATFVEAFVNIGLVLDSGGSYFLLHGLGYHKAFELATLGDKFTAIQAEQWGLVNKIAEEENLETVTMEIASRYADGATKAIGLIKRMLNRAANSSLADMLQQEAWYQEIAGRSADYKEGVKAFLEKRKPLFTGK